MKGEIKYEYESFISKWKIEKLSGNGEIVMKTVIYEVKKVSRYLKNGKSFFSSNLSFISLLDIFPSLLPISFSLLSLSLSTLAFFLSFMWLSLFRPLYLSSTTELKQWTTRFLKDEQWPTFIGNQFYLFDVDTLELLLH